MKSASLVTLIVFALTVVSVPVAGTAEFPDRPITLLVGFAPGGSLDLSARALAQAAEKIIGQSITVENKTGGTGSVALSALLSAKADGYTLVATPSSVLVRVSQVQPFPFKPLRDFKPLIGYCTPELGLVVKSDAPWQTIKEFADYTKSNPGKVTFASVGNGSTTHGAVEEMLVKDSSKMIHIPYKGSIEAIAALLGGHVDMASVTSEFVPSVQAGQTRLLATMGEKRSPKFPEAPTMKESGYPFVNETVYAIVAPAALPTELVDRLEQAFAKAMEDHAYQTALDKMDLTPVSYNSGTLSEFLDTSWKKVNTQLIQAGIVKEAATQPR